MNRVPGWPARLAPYRRQKHEPPMRGVMVVMIRIDLGNGPEWLPVGVMK